MSRALGIKLRRDLWALRAQTGTIAILIVSGVSLLVATWSAYGSLRGAKASYYADYRFADVFADFKRASGEIQRKLEAAPGVEALHLRVAGEGLVTTASRAEPAVGRFLSLPAGRQPPVNLIHLRQGRLPEVAEEAEVMVHEGFASARGLSPGSVIEIQLEGRRERARVVGIGLSPEFVYSLSPSAPLPDDLHFGVFWMAEKVLQRLMRLEDGFNSVAIRLSAGASRDRAIAALDETLRPYGSLGAYGRDRQISNMFVEDEIAQQRSSAIFIPAIFLGIATFLVNIVASRLIALHRPQIATLKAIGYSRWEVSRHYLGLMLLMTFSGALPGIGLGTLLGRWMSNTYQAYFRFPDLHFSVSSAAAVIGLVAGVLPGLLGAWTAIRRTFLLAPAEAMRPPAPPQFHATLMERWRLTQKLGARSRMVLRNLIFRPVKLALIVASLSAALSVLIAAGAWGDIVSFLLANQFNRLQREDLSISLVRPRPSGALQEIAGLPGVIAAEGYRAVPVRVRFRNHKREITLTGWPEGAAMRRRLDTSLRAIALPEQGLLLSRFFQSAWGLRAGDSVELEPLEGKRSPVLVPIAGFTDDLVGTGAGMRLEALWALLHEQPAYNVITVQAEPRRLDELYLKLKGFPEVASVAMKGELYRGFRSSFGSVIRSTTNVLMAASLLIALGIIYNSVRVSFSERAWELASLRVLGFARGQVSAVLLSEVAVQVLFSLVPGCLLGLALTHLSLKLIHTETFGFPVVIELATYARGILTVLLAFLASAWIIQRMVSRLSPADALKSRE